MTESTKPTTKLEKYNALTDAKKAAIWKQGRDAGESVKTIRLNRTGHGPSAALREWHRLTDLGLLKDPIGKRGRPTNGTTKAPAKKTAATKKATPAKATAAKKVVSATKRAATAKRTGGTKATEQQPEAEAS